MVERGLHIISSGRLLPPSGSAPKNRLVAADYYLFLEHRVILLMIVRYLPHLIPCAQVLPASSLPKPVEGHLPLQRASFHGRLEPRGHGAILYLVV